MKIYSRAQLRRAVLPIAKNHRVKDIRLFGSFARNEQGPKSDVDFLVKMPNGSTLLDLVGLKTDLQKILGRKVDVVPSNALKRTLRNRILADAHPL